jgi:hypothetical protein
MFRSGYDAPNLDNPAPAEAHLPRPVAIRRADTPILWWW